ncbi:MAG: sigma-70 family RNA polymerase sigma factor [Acidobacteria bacterium]|nr:sigma-70 family RNA polymerase sigma factor [Acidobacteriota bacterium]MCI0623694.1 sigma-70 family RNA polymerase sigma factor [Acidobacteriota bacterium]MCI0720867.1 sigma-70 family RNA polymerase sigma factor [Acidobacteriota bacterium]
MNFKYSATGELWLDREALCAIRGHAKVGQVVAEIFELLRDPVYRYLVGILGNPTEAEDLLQEAFLRLYQCLCKGQPVSNIRAWVYRVAHNLAVDQQRKNSHVDSFDPEAWDRVCARNGDRVATAEQRVLDQERKALFQKALETLSPQERHCLNLKAEGLLYREMAEILGLRVSTVATFVDRAIKKLMSETHD